MVRRVLALAAVGALAVAAFTVAAGAQPALVEDPAGIIDLPAGYSYDVLATACVDDVTSTESGATFPMAEDFDGNVLFPAPGGELWLLSNHELTEPRPGDFTGDAGKCNVPEQSATDDGDSDAWGSVTRLVLANDGTTVLDRQVITTGLHNLCAANPTPWGTYITNEEFPFHRRLPSNDPQKRAGWAWEVDPATGEATRLTGMGFFSHEQADRVGGAWYQTDDQGDMRFLYKFVPDRFRDLTEGNLYGLKFDRATMTGRWIGPLDPMDPHNDMVARLGPGWEAYAFGKAEGLVKAQRRGAFVFTESGATTADPGRVWEIVDRAGVARGEVLAEGDWVNFSRPDNLRYAPSGDLYIMEDHGSSDRRDHPEINANEDIWALPKGETGTENLVRFANTPDEPTGPWFSQDGKHFYLSLQGNPSRVLVVSGDFGGPGLGHDENDG